jgi:probable HAF family extracellular repeat protein
LWDRGVLKDLGTMGGRNSLAQGINAKGDIVGWSEITSGELHAVLWRQGRFTDLGTLGGTHSVATDINAAGHIVGYSAGRGIGDQAVIWKDGLITPLANLPGGNGGAAFAINESGQIAGTATAVTTRGLQTHATLWTR